MWAKKKHRKQIAPMETRMLVASLTIRRIFLRIKGLRKELGRIISALPLVLTASEDSDEFLKIAR